MITKQDKRQLLILMSDPKWSILEKFKDEYMKEHFINDSAKRQTEFDTIWYIAENEGGKTHINSLFNELDNIANHV